MGNRRFLWLGMFFLGYAFAKAQSLSTPNVTQLPLTATVFYGVDDFENIYYSNNNVLFKKPLTSIKATQQFYDVQLGDLTSIDLINPLKIVLFYKDTQTVVFVDNRLNESLRIDLSGLQPYRYFDFVGLAGERRLWLFNTDADRVELYDYINNTLVVSSPVVKNDVKAMLTDYNFCHLILPQGIASYNNYGSRTAFLPVPQIGYAAYDFEKLVVQQQDQWEFYQFAKDYSFTKAQKSWPYNANDTLHSLYLKSGKLYLYHHNRLSVLTD